MFVVIQSVYNKFINKFMIEKQNLLYPCILEQALLNTLFVVYGVFYH